MSFVFGLIGGLVGGLVSLRLTGGRAFLPSHSLPEVVEKRGPSLYTTQTRRKPKFKTEKELWEIENKENLQG